MDAITLRAEDAGLEVVPAAGGAVARYWLARGGTTWDWLRPAPASALVDGDPYEVAAAFPLVPFSNRIREGRFRFEGREVVLPANRPPERHSIHGHGWQARWTCVDATTAEALLEYHHPVGAWPWAYRATQRFALTPASLAVELTLTNESGTRMPAGLGWHPYFPRSEGTTITAAVTAVWLTDDAMLPTTLVPPPAIMNPTGGLAAGRVAVDNGFVGWSRRAVVAWPERDARLVMTASSPLDVLVVYTPPGRSYLCIEPVSHVTDALNLASAGRTDTGLRVLEPGERFQVVIALTPELGGSRGA
jgi:aldose 1-epimerase